MKKTIPSFLFACFSCCIVTSPLFAYSPQTVHHFTKVDDSLYIFGQYRSVTALSKSDGTEEGTKTVKQLKFGFNPKIPAHKQLGWDKFCASMNHKLFFTAWDDRTGVELWKSDGTGEGTSIVKDIEPGTISSDPQSLTVVNNTLYFTAETATNGRQLWKSDGTAQGTVMLPTTAKPNLTNLTSLNDKLLFSNLSEVAVKTQKSFGGIMVPAGSTVSLFELWTSDGTPEGTKSFAAHPNPNQFLDVNQDIGAAFLNTLNDKLMFRTYDIARGQYQLWKTDGTPAGTIKLKEFAASTHAPVISRHAAVMKGKLYFFANDSKHGTELWQSDGTPKGTRMVGDFKPGVASSAEPGSREIGQANGLLFFSATHMNATDKHGLELWKSDGTAAGTKMVKDLVPGKSHSRPMLFTAVGKNLYFIASKLTPEGIPEYSLYKTDGSRERTIKVKDFSDSLSNLPPTLMQPFRQRLYFILPHRDSSDGVFWTSDGTSEGTTPAFSVPVR